MASGVTQSTNNTTDYSIVGRRVTYVLTASAALLGNLFVVFLFTRRPEWLSKSHNRCILSLAIADILTAISIFTNPRLVLEDNIYKVSSQSYLTREIYCRMLWSHYLPFSLGVASLYTCVVLSLERWLAVTKSIFYKNRFTTKHMNILIIASWIIGFVVEIPVTLFTEGVYDGTPRVCQWNISHNTKSLAGTISLCFAQGVLPFSLIFAAYVDIFRTIKASIRFGESARTVSINNVQRMKKVIQMTAITSFVLLISWTPGQVYFLFSLLGYTAINPDENFITFLGALVFCNSWINPLVYVFSNTAFQKAIKEIFCEVSVHDSSQQRNEQTT